MRNAVDAPRPASAYPEPMAKIVCPECGHTVNIVRTAPRHVRYIAGSGCSKLDET